MPGFTGSFGEAWKACRVHAERRNGMTNHKAQEESFPDWLCHADQEAFTDYRQHLTTYNRAIKGCSEHPWSGGCSIDRGVLEDFIAERELQAAESAVEERAELVMAQLTKPVDHVDEIVLPPGLASEQAKWEQGRKAGIGEFYGALVDYKHKEKTNVR